jgi:hypothetical protein
MNKNSRKTVVIP